MLLRHLVAVAAISGSLLTLGPTPAPAASAAQDPPGTRPCFLEPVRRNPDVDPLPRCPAFDSPTPAPEPEPEPEAAVRPTPPLP